MPSYTSTFSPANVLFAMPTDNLFIGNETLPTSAEFTNDDSSIHMITKTKSQFELSNFSKKYNSILARKIDPHIKTENIKLCTASIMNTLKDYFCKNDPDDITELNEYMEQILSENIELSTYVNKLIKLKDKKNNPNNYIDIDINTESNTLNQEIDIDIDISTSLAQQLLSERERKAYEKTAESLGQLIRKRQDELSGMFHAPDQVELDRIFKNQIQSNKEGEAVIEQSNHVALAEANWNELTTLMKELDISSNIIALLGNINSFRQELNETHQNFLNLRKVIDNFNTIISSQLKWIESIPYGLDGDIIRQNIEESLIKNFDGQDIIALFREYKKTYSKMMLLITFIPREFTSKDACSICLTNQKGIVFVPCGHTCCASCSDSIVECMICRASIKTKQKIFDC